MVGPEVFDKIRLELSDEFVNRDTEIETLILAFLTEANVVLLGPPGTGKSQLVRRILDRIEGATIFNTLLMKEADISSVFGPLSLAGLKNEQRVRADGDWLQRVHFGFVDETFKGGAALLNALLKLMNERLFEEDGVEHKVPLVSLVGASNEMPDMAEGLAAMWDRWQFRLHVDPVVDAGDLRRMATTVWNPVPDKSLSIGNLVTAQQAARAVPVSDAALDAVTDITVKLRREHGIEVTGRKYMEALRIASGAAWLAGATEVDVSHLGFLQHMLWDRPEQQRDVANTVLAVSAPMLREVHDIEDALGVVAERLQDILADPEDEGARSEVPAIVSKLKRAAKNLVEVEQKLGRRDSAVDRVASVVQSLYRQAIVDGMGIDAAVVEDLVNNAREGKL